MKSLTSQEEQLMKYVWKLKKGFIKDFRGMYPENERPPYTTIASIMKKLEEKGYVSAKQYGNCYEYRPKVEKENFKNKLISDLVSNYFQNSYKKMVNFFAQKEKLSEEDLEEIINIIKKKK